MPSYLPAILAVHRARAATDERRLDAVVEQARAQPSPRDFAGALGAAGISVIAEVKRRSPSAGDLARDLDPARVGRAYAAGGAACLSVLTDAAHFGGSVADLQEARAASGLPTLRKDFTVSALDVADARAMGADAVLLIAAALDDAELRDFSGLASELGLAALVEVHDEAELERAIAVEARLIGINQRDLRTFEVDRERAERLAGAVPAGTLKVAESGIRDAADVSRLAAGGFDAVLVGETLVRSPDPRVALLGLRGQVATTCS